MFGIVGSSPVSAGVIPSVPSGGSTPQGTMLNYKKVKVLGKGGFGVALLCDSVRSPGKLVVIKEVNLGRSDRKAQEDAKMESEFLRTLRHPNIVRFVESFIERGNLYIVMEYADGGDLHQRIDALRKRGKYLTEEESLDIFVQICLAIKHVHDRKVVHRDLKSQNVFLTSNGLVRLGDFGIAKRLASSQMMLKTQIGTPYYLSPEVCLGRAYSYATDIWSMGVILYEMLGGTLPFSAPDLPRLVSLILKAAPPPLSKTNVTEVTRSLVNDLLQKDPRKRPSINAVLRNPAVRSRIQLFLSQTAARGFGQALATSARFDTITLPADNVSSVGVTPQPSNTSAVKESKENIPRSLPLKKETTPAGLQVKATDAPKPLLALHEGRPLAMAPAVPVAQMKVMALERERQQRLLQLAQQEQQRQAREAELFLQRQRKLEQERKQQKLLAEKAAAEERKRRALIVQQLEQKRQQQQQQERLRAAQERQKPSNYDLNPGSKNSPSGEADAPKKSFDEIERLKRRQYEKDQLAKWKARENAIFEAHNANNIENKPSRDPDILIYHAVPRQGAKKRPDRVSPLENNNVDVADAPGIQNEACNKPPLYSEKKDHVSADIDSAKDAGVQRDYNYFADLDERNSAQSKKYQREQERIRLENINNVRRAAERNAAAQMAMYKPSVEDSGPFVPPSKARGIELSTQVDESRSGRSKDDSAEEYLRQYNAILSENRRNRRNSDNSEKESVIVVAAGSNSARSSPPTLTSSRNNSHSISSHDRSPGDVGVNRSVEADKSSLPVRSASEVRRLALERKLALEAEREMELRKEAKENLRRRKELLQKHAVVDNNNVVVEQDRDSADAARDTEGDDFVANKDIVIFSGSRRSSRSDNEKEADKDDADNLPAGPLIIDLDTKKKTSKKPILSSQRKFTHLSSKSSTTDANASNINVNDSSHAIKHEGIAGSSNKRAKVPFAQASSNPSATPMQGEMGSVRAKAIIRNLSRNGYNPSLLRKKSDENKNSSNSDFEILIYDNNNRKHTSNVDPHDKPAASSTSGIDSVLNNLGITAYFQNHRGITGIIKSPLKENFNSECSDVSDTITSNAVDNTSSNIVDPSIASTSISQCRGVTFSEVKEDGPEDDRSGTSVEIVRLSTPLGPHLFNPEGEDSFSSHSSSLSGGPLGSEFSEEIFSSEEREALQLEVDMAGFQAELLEALEVADSDPDNTNRDKKKNCSPSAGNKKDLIDSQHSETAPYNGSLGAEAYDGAEVDENAIDIGDNYDFEAELELVAEDMALYASFPEDGVEDENVDENTDDYHSIDMDNSQEFDQMGLDELSYSLTSELDGDSSDVIDGSEISENATFRTPSMHAAMLALSQQSLVISDNDDDDDESFSIHRKQFSQANRVNSFQDADLGATQSSVASTVRPVIIKRDESLGIQQLQVRTEDALDISSDDDDYTQSRATGAGAMPTATTFEEKTFGSDESGDESALAFKRILAPRRKSPS